MVASGVTVYKGGQAGEKREWNHHKNSSYFENFGRANGRWNKEVIEKDLSLVVSTEKAKQYEKATLI